MDLPDSLIQAHPRCEGCCDLGLGLVLAAALYNTLNYAEANGDAALRDRSLEELRSIVKTYPAATLPSASRWRWVCTTL